MWGYILTATVFFVGGFFVAAMLAAGKMADAEQKRILREHQEKNN